MPNIGNTLHPVDTHVGGRVRVRRKFLRLSQDDLARQIGLTFQQVQKYERGTNRISASKLFQISRVLNTPIDYFFDGIDDDKGLSPYESRAGHAADTFLTMPEGIEMAETFPRVTSEQKRRSVLELVRALAED